MLRIPERYPLAQGTAGSEMPQALTATGPMSLHNDLSRRPSLPPRVPVETANVSGVETPDQRRAAWMAAGQAGDRRAYEQLLADSVALIRAAARRQGVAFDHLDDVVQETLLTVHRVRHTYDPGRSYDADRKSTRLNSSHHSISYAVFCLKKKK